MKFKYVKIYRVVHQIIPYNHVTNGFQANDPELYRPIFLGDYDKDGNLLSILDEDPYLYWLIPILSERPSDPFSPVKDWTRFHAGDKRYIRHPIVANKQILRYEWTEGPPPEEWPIR